MNTYTFVTKDGKDIDVSIITEYADDTYDVEVRFSDKERVWEEVDSGAVEEMINWLIEEGAQFANDKTMRFNFYYVTSVMMDKDTTQSKLLAKMATWTDEEIARWKAWIVD